METWERIAQARDLAERDPAVLADLVRWAKARQENDLVEGNLPPWQVEHAVENLLHEKGIDSYHSCAVGLARLHNCLDAAPDAAMLAERIARGVVLYEGVIDRLYVGFELLFQHARAQFLRQATYRHSAA